MRIPESKIAEVAAAADIVQVISDYVNLKKAGKDYRGICPFHGDKDPSFYVSPQKGIFHCFGCSVGGSVFNFIMRVENTSFVEAVRLLAGRYGVPFHFEQDRRTVDEKSNLEKALSVAQEYFKDSLHDGSSAKEYLIGRGVPDQSITLLELGFAPDSWDGVQGRLRSAGVDSKDAVSAGLLRSRAGGGFYDYFRSRVMIPIRDMTGKLIGFGGRILGPGEPKYLNSPDSAVFRKKNVLFGLDTAREAIRTEGFVVLVEGYFDQISLRIRGLENTVAPLGTALGTEQVKLLKRFTSDVIAVFDGDEAGLRAVKRAIPLFLSEGIEPRCLILTEDKDPDEAVNRIGVEAFRKELDGAGSAIDFFLDSVESRYDVNAIQGRNLALEECLPVLREIADSKEADYLIERFSSRIKVREDRLRRILRSGPNIRRPERVVATDHKKNLFDFPADERNVVRGMLLRDGFIERVLESGVLKDLEDSVLSDLAERMVSFRQQEGQFDPVAFSRSLEDHNLASIIAGWLKPRPEEDDLRPEVDGDLAIDHSVDSIRLRKLERRKDEIKERMKKCPAGEEEYNLLAQEFWAIARRLHK
ncbi:MAG: DNA primase [Desulfomonile tiedjei]|uniref:DNA primase n=1 Tax=Desulfomonile tiedjei TaxID=2358 RepID=A0A9D6UZU7_9BACT|nr:DNA primase [Desulfomonile tiedjei]